MKPIIAGNWKMNKDPAESRSLIQQLLIQIGDVKERTIIVIPPFTSLPHVAEIVRNTSLKIGAQNMHWERSGAYTGEISGLFLTSLGVEYVLIGHSERRHVMGETNDILNRKLKTALDIGLISIFCVGETEQERDQNKTEDVILEQLQTGLKGIEPEVHKMIIAYEPVWAIGTGKTATPEQAADVHAFIRKHLKKPSAILYGGSVNPDNVEAIMAQAEIDGVLVGGASLKPASFARIVNVTIP
jgi:triosephosphate isomerase